LTVDSTAVESKNIVVTVVIRDTDTAAESDPVDLVREDSTCVAIKINPTTVPSDAENFPMKVDYLDQYGNKIPQPAGAEITWSKVSGGSGVQLTSDGLLTLNGFSGTFTVRAVLSDTVRDDAVITVSERKLADERLATVELFAQSPVTIPVDNDLQVQVTNKLTGEFGTDMTGKSGITLTWSGEGVDSNGELTVKAKSASQAYEVTVEAKRNTDETATGSVSVYANREISQVAKVEILTDTVNRDNPQLQAKVTDQYGEEMIGASVKWELVSDTEGVTVAENGVVVIGEGVEDFTVRATSGDKSAEQKITVSDDEPVPDHIILTRLDSTTDSVTAPGTAQYSAEVRDQFGGRINVQHMDWSIDPYVIGVDVDRNGNVTVYDTAETGTANVTVSALGLTASKALHISGNKYEEFAGLEITPTAVKEGETEVQLHASYVDSFGSNMGEAEDATFEIDSYQPSNANPKPSVTPDGKLDMGGATSVTVTGTAPDGHGKNVTGEVTVTVVPEDTPSEVDHIRVDAISGVDEDRTISVPTMVDADTPGKTTAKFKAVIFDQYDAEMTDYTAIVWSIQSRPKGISIDQNGVLTLTSEAADGKYLIEAAAANGVTGTYTLIVEREITGDQLTFTFLKVEDVVLNANETSGKLVMKFLDQYGDETTAPAFTGNNNTWTKQSAKPDGTLNSVTATPDTSNYQSVTVAMGSAESVTMRASITVSGKQYTADGSIGRRSESFSEELGLHFEVINQNGTAPDYIRYWQDDPTAEGALKNGDIIRVYAMGDNENSFKLVAEFVYEMPANPAGRLRKNLDLYLPVEGGVAYITRQGNGMESDPYPATMDVPFNAEDQVYVASYLQITEGKGSAPGNPIVVLPGENQEADVLAAAPDVITVVSSTGTTLTLGTVGSDHYVEGAGQDLIKIDKDFIDSQWLQSYTDGSWKTTHVMSFILPDVVNQNRQNVIVQPDGGAYTAYFYIMEGTKNETNPEGLITKIDPPRTLNLTEGTILSEKDLTNMVEDLNGIDNLTFYLNHSETPEADGKLGIMQNLPEQDLGNELNFLGWQLGEKDGENWKPVQAFRDAPEGDERDALVAELLSTYANSEKYALIACPDYATYGYKVDTESYPYVAVPIKLYSATATDPNDPNAPANPLQLTDGNNDLWLHGADNTSLAYRELVRRGDITSSTGAEDIQKVIAKYRTDLVFYFNFENYENDVKPYINAETNITSLMVDGEELTGDRLAQWLSDATVTVEQLNADGTEISIETDSAGTVNYIEPHHSDTASKYFVFGASVTRFIEEYVIRYTVQKDGNVYMVNRKVKLIYRSGDLDANGLKTYDDVSRQQLVIAGASVFVATGDISEELEQQYKDAGNYVADPDGNGLRTYDDVSLIQRMIAGEDYTDKRW
ncbi:MAG: hypothetical protein J1E06_08335, partial [Acutalibacter sp.]|nr:hypothetical protein [Acutalibacter sp.]